MGVIHADHHGVVKHCNGTIFKRPEALGIPLSEFLGENLESTEDLKSISLANKSVLEHRITEVLEPIFGFTEAHAYRITIVPISFSDDAESLARA